MPDFEIRIRCLVAIQFSSFQQTTPYLLNQNQRLKNTSCASLQLHIILVDDILILLTPPTSPPQSTSTNWNAGMLAARTPAYVVAGDQRGRCVGAAKGGVVARRAASSRRRSRASGVAVPGSLLLPLPLPRPNPRGSRHYWRTLPSKSTIRCGAHFDFR